MTVTGKINLNENTETHPETLRSLGYEVTIDPTTKTCLIECSDFLPQGSKVDPIDCSTAEKAVAFFRDVVAQKKLVGYNTRITLPGNLKRFGAPLCAALQDSTALRDKLGFDPTALIAIRPKVKRADLPKDLFA